MLKLILLAGLLSAPLAAQLQLVCAQSDPSFSRAIFDKKTARIVRHWTCTARNLSMSPVVVTEADLLQMLMQSGVPAMPTDALRTAYVEYKRRGPWSTLGRVFTYGGGALSVAQGVDIIDVGAGWAAAGAIAAVALPQIAGMLAGRNPETSNFEQMALHADLGLAPEGRVVVSLFSAPVDEVRFVDAHLGLTR